MYLKAGGAMVSYVTQADLELLSSASA
jgi:hypothetical protein